MRLGCKSSGHSGKRMGCKMPPPTAGAAADELNEDEKLHRDVANESYENEDERKDLGDDGIYQYKAEDSDKRTGVWHNADTQHTVIGHRGTADLGDVNTDLFSIKGNIFKGTQRNNPLFKADLEHFDRTAEKYGGNISVGGHSLGSSRSENVSRNRNVRAHGFNTGRGFGFQQIKEKVTCSSSNPPAWCDKMTRHHIRGDPLSLVDRLSYGKTKVYDSRGLKSHMMSSFYN